MNKKYFVVGALVMSALCTTSFARAEDGNRGTGMPGRPAMPSDMQKRMPSKNGPNSENRADIKDMRDGMKEDRMEQRQEQEKMHGEIKDLRNTINPNMTEEERALINEKIRMMKGERKDDRKEFKDGMKEKRSEIKDVRHEILRNRFTAMNERLAGLATRIDSRLDKMATEGKDVTEAKAKLAAAKNKIAEAAGKASTIKENPNQDPAIMATNKAITEETKTLMKDAQKMLIDIVSGFKVEKSTSTTTK